MVCALFNTRSKRGCKGDQRQLGANDVFALARRDRGQPLQQGRGLCRRCRKFSSNEDRNKEYPASLDFAAQITVGAVGEYDYLAEYSNYGSVPCYIRTRIQTSFSNGAWGHAVLKRDEYGYALVAGAIAVC